MGNTNTSSCGRRWAVLGRKRKIIFGAESDFVSMQGHALEAGRYAHNFGLLFRNPEVGERKWS